MKKVYEYAILVLLAVILVGGTGWYMTHLRSQIDLANSKLVEAEASLGMCASGLDATTAATDLAKKRADLMQSQAQDVIDGAGKDKKANAAAAATFSTKVSTAAKASDCQAVLEAQLCPALSGY